ncbi:MAG: hypothetical protein IPL41_13505 [Micropruina sp.]|nr:hypothetical protein [Micropruina sp.]
MSSVLGRVLAVGGAAALVLGAGSLASTGTAEATAPRIPVRQSSAPTLPRQTSCSGVWVVVDFGSLGGATSTECATSHVTGLDALRSAGFAPLFRDSFVYSISGRPSKPDINKAYWSYWQAIKQDDGSYSAWTYSTLGAGVSQPEQGSAEGWSYISLGAGNTPPGVKPPTGGTGSVPPTASSSPDTTQAAPADATPQSSAAPDAGNGSGSPVGAIVVGSVVVAAGAGLGGWWLLKGRKP